MLDIKVFDKNSHFSIIEDFCKQRELPLIEKDLLNDYGFIVFNNNVPVVCGFLYPTLGSKLCIIENVIRNKDLKDKKIIDEGFVLLFSTLHAVAKDMGYKCIKNTVENNSMKDRLQEYGYVILNENVTNFIGVL